jgi:putative SOS response-associated peptidase YedK
VRGPTSGRSGATARSTRSTSTSSSTDCSPSLASGHRAPIDESGEIIESCTIITTTPNELVARVHDRMPVILPTADEAVWLDPAISKEHALSLLQPYPAELMIALPASTRANSTRNDDSGLLLPDDALAA